MKTLRRIVFLTAFAIIVGCTLLQVTNFDPTNPTNRRYSSEPVITIGEDKDKGDSGEDVLSKDLGQPINDRANPRLAFCNPKYSEKPPRSDVKCIYFSETINDHRIPDFITRDFIADSKNRHTWNLSDLGQIKAFVEAALDKRIPLWIYVRHNTQVAPEYHDLVESTGGRVLYYFRTEQPYVDSVDFYLLMGIIGGLSMIVIWVGVVGIVTYFTPTPKSSVVVPEHTSSRKARQAVDDMDRFLRDAGDNARRTLDD